MRVTRFRLFLMLGGSLLLLGPAIGLGQPGQWQGGPPGGFQGPPGGFQNGPPGGFQGPPGGQQGRRRGNFDPNMIFNMISQGKDYIVVADWLPMAAARDPNAKDRIEAFMQRMNITNGQLTRDQFAQFMQERMAQRQADRAANPNAPQNPNAANNPNSPDAATDDGEPPPPEDKRSVVYRAGNLPQGLPTWFASMDTDQDGQVGLYEWKAQGRAVSEFQSIDLNGDGFITVEEALRYQKSQGVVVAAGAPFPSTGAPSFGQPSFNGPPNGFNNGQFGNRANRGNRGNQGYRGNRGNRGGQPPGFGG